MFKSFKNYFYISPIIYTSQKDNEMYKFVIEIFYIVVIFKFYVYVFHVIIKMAMKHFQKKKC